jgi:hypothetical protein
VPGELDRRPDANDDDHRADDDQHDDHVDDEHDDDDVVRDGHVVQRCGEASIGVTGTSTRCDLS